jgi:hypothetical protein
MAITLARERHYLLGGAELLYKGQYVRTSWSRGPLHSIQNGEVHPLYNVTLSSDSHTHLD